MTFSDKTPLLLPLSPVRNRTTEVIDRITSEIVRGSLEPGTRLPTEHQLMTAMGVSRTVVREAVAALKANGLVTTRQGAGAFVSDDGARIPFRIDPDGLTSIDDVIKVMELRLAVEVEAAGLAAERAIPAGIRGMKQALLKMDRAIGLDGAAIAEDFAFHQAVADATQNKYFEEFLLFLGRHVIPRQSVRLQPPSAGNQSGYLRQIQAEHRKIATAIIAFDAKRARQAMRLHLNNSLQRYRRLAEQAAKQ